MPSPFDVPDPTHLEPVTEPNFSVELGASPVVVTGAASGIGAAVAALLKSFDAEVIGLDIAEGAGEGVECLRCDLADLGMLDRVIDELKGRKPFGLVNVAGVSGSQTPEQVFAVNFLGLRHLTEALLPELEAGGAVVQVSSTAGVYWRDDLARISEALETASFEEGQAWCSRQGMGGPEAYEFSKAAVTAHALANAAEARRRFGIRLNVVSPGQIETPLLDEFYRTMDSTLLERMRAAVGGVNGTPSQVAPVVAFLLSSAAEWVSGADIWVDGGAEAAEAIAAGKEDEVRAS